MENKQEENKNKKRYILKTIIIVLIGFIFYTLFGLVYVWYNSVNQNEISNKLTNDIVYNNEGVDSLQGYDVNDINILKFNYNNNLEFDINRLTPGQIQYDNINIGLHCYDNTFWIPKGTTFNLTSYRNTNTEIACFIDITSMVDFDFDQYIYIMYHNLGNGIIYTDFFDFKIVNADYDDPSYVTGRFQNTLLETISFNDYNSNIVQYEAGDTPNGSYYLKISINSDYYDNFNFDDTIVFTIASANDSGYEYFNHTTSVYFANDFNINYIDSLTSDLSSQLEELQSQYNTLNNQYTSLQSQYNTLNNTYQNLVSSNNTLQSNYDTLQTNYNTLQSNYDTLYSSNETLQSSYNTLQSNYNTLNTTYQALASEHTSLQSSYDTLNTNYNNLNNSYQALLTSNAELQNNYDTLLNLYNNVLDENASGKLDNSNIANTSYITINNENIVFDTSLIINVSYQVNYSNSSSGSSNADYSGITLSQLLKHYYNQSYYQYKITLNFIKEINYQYLVGIVGNTQSDVGFEFLDNQNRQIGLQWTRGENIYNFDMTNDKLNCASLVIYCDDILTSDDVSCSIYLAKNGYQSGYNVGYQEGFDNGKYEGKIEGIETADNRINTESASYQSGYDIGYNKGAEEDFASNGFLTLISGIFAYPINLISNFFNFEFMGINILALVTFLITIGIVVFVIRKFK